MTDEEYKALYAKAKAFAKGKRGLSDPEAEDFAQEYCIKTLEKGPIRIDWTCGEYLRKHRAHKRKLSSLEKSLSAPGTLSLDAPIDSSEGNGKQYSDIIGVPGYDVASRSGPDQDLTAGEKLDEQVGLFLSTIGLDERAIKWANQTLKQSLSLRKQRILMKENRQFKRLMTSSAWVKPSSSSKK